jgi:hypothetical protein
LIGDKPLDVKFTGTAPQKPVGRYKLVGTRVPRLDIPDKVAVKYTHMQHVRVAGMLHGRVVRPRGQRGYGTEPSPSRLMRARLPALRAPVWSGVGISSAWSPNASGTRCGPPATSG